MITISDMEKALHSIISTDEECAILLTRVKALEKKEKVILSQKFVELKGCGTNQERECLARTTQDYKNWLTEYEATVLDYQIKQLKRDSQILLIDCWRSLNANQRKGNI